MSIMSALRRNVFIPLWVMKDNSPRLYYMKKLRESDYQDIEVLRETQFSKLRKIIDHAYRHTVYYKEKFDELGIVPQEIKDKYDFRRIPILTKELSSILTQVCPR